jgi:serine/threonine-protein kinase
MTDPSSTLSAILAADRLQLSETVEGKDLLHRRLTVFYGYFALLGVLTSAATRLGRMPTSFDPTTLGFVLNVQSAHALVLCLVFLALKFRVQRGPLVRVLDLLATLATAITAAVALSGIPFVVSVDTAALGFFVLFFMVRAALIPGKPWVATLTAALCAVPFALGFGILYRTAGPGLVPDATGATIAVIRTMLAGIAAVYLVSRTIYGLRSAVEKAVQLGQYVIIDKIGEGGMGSVFRASHALLKRPTAIKVISPERAGETATARFEREVMSTSRLTHPNNVAIYDFGRTRGGVFYYAMELLDGEDLGKLVEREGPQPIARARHVLRQIGRSNP